MATIQPPRPTRSRHGAAVWALGLAGTLSLTACVNLAPTLERPVLPVASTLPVTDGAAPGVLAQPGWQTLLRDERLRQVVALALANNRDWRVALLNVERSRAQLGLADADRWPTLSAALIASRAPNSKGVEANNFQAGLQLSSYEVDLLGKLRNASDAAAATLLATEAAGRSARLALVSQTASAWLTLAADGEQLALLRQTLKSREDSLRLTVLREKVGAASALDLSTAQTLVAAARAGAAQLERQHAQDLNALQLLVGSAGALPAALLPGEQEPLADDGLAAVPAGLSSDVLLGRPDIVQAEQQLAAANANIGVARAALFPHLTLSGSGGQASDSLRTLFDAGHFASTVTANLAVALFDGGRNRANVQVAEINRDVAVAQYEKALQVAFREAADALQAQSSWRTQVQAQQQQLTAETTRHQLVQLRLTQGAASLTDLLDADRSLVSAQQTLVQVRLAEQLNRLALYKALGGGEATAAP
jgi:multidrug efflux system outer membrane protein